MSDRSVVQLFDYLETPKNELGHYGSAMTMCSS